MKRLNNILLAVFLVFFALNGRAQGDVVVHSDPRLSLLLKKSHPAIASTTKPTSHKTASSLNNGEATVPHPSEILTAPHTGEMAVRTSVKPPTAPTTAVVAPVATKANTGTVTPVAAKANTTAAASPPPASSTVWVSHRNVRTIYTGKGFRVQIYRGTDRNKAMEVKNEFARSNPGVRTYLSYISPCFRVKVGDYRRRVEAEGMWREANSTYNPSMIVPDIITVTTTE